MGGSFEAKALSDNKRFVQAVFKSRKRFDALRSFTLESGQEEIERQKQRQKDSADVSSSAVSPTWNSRHGSMDSVRTPVNARSPALSNVPEEGGAFAIGDDEDSDDEEGHEMLPTPSHSSPPEHNSRTPSIASSADEPLPAQLRGMSEKARGKMPAGQPSFSRQNSTISLSSHQPNVMSPAAGFQPSAQWVSSNFKTSLSLPLPLTVLTPPRSSPGSRLYLYIQYLRCCHSLRLQPHFHQRSTLPLHASICLNGLLCPLAGMSLSSGASFSPRKW